MTPSANVSLSKTSVPGPVQVGDDIVYTRAPQTPSPATGVTVSEQLAGRAHPRFSPPSKGTCAATSTVTCDIGTVAAGAANDVNVTIVAPAGPGAVPSVTNTVTLDRDRRSGLDERRGERRPRSEPLGGPVDQRRTRRTPCPPATTSPTPWPSTTRAQTAAAGAVTATLPKGLALVSATASQGACAGTATVRCALGAVEPGAANERASRSSRPPARAVPGVTNTATVSSARPRPHAGNNEAGADTTVEPSADVKLRTAMRPIRSPSGTMTYTLSVHNAGPSPAADVASPIPSPRTSPSCPPPPARARAPAPGRSTASSARRGRRRPRRDGRDRRDRGADRGSRASRTPPASPPPPTIPALRTTRRAPPPRR